MVQSKTKMVQRYFKGILKKIAFINRPNLRFFALGKGLVQKGKVR